MTIAEEFQVEAIVNRPMAPIEAAIAAFADKIAAIDKTCRESTAAASRAFADSSEVVDRVYHAEIEQARRQRMAAIEATVDNPDGLLAADGPFYARIQEAYRISQESRQELEQGRNVAVQAAKTVRIEGIEAARRHIAAVIRREIEGAIWDALAGVFEGRGV